MNYWKLLIFVSKAYTLSNNPITVINLFRFIFYREKKN